MKLVLSNEVITWFEKEMNIKPGDAIRFFVRYGGCDSFQKGFSLGVMKDEPNDVAVQQVINGVTYYIEEKDLWYFEDHDLHVTYNEKWDEPTYEYVKSIQS
ncbi:HesB/YadR/YfhF family protein [Aeribacillus pallidus]|uniref:HesB/YadR/YfhF family protein n=1 Tax=Aeribacillus pallidus TaxID=33936 RepID=UPI003D1A5772